MADHGIRLTFQSGLCREQVQLCSMEMRTLCDQAFNFLERQYPDHVTKYLDLQDSIILMVHREESMTERMEVINDVKDLQRGDVVEVVISKNAREVNTNIRPHLLFVHSYKSPTFCDFCGEMLWGLVRQGVKCDGCGANYHKRCAYRIPNNCSRQRERLRRQSVASTTTPNLPLQADIASILDLGRYPPSQPTGPGGHYIGRPIEIDIVLREHSKGKVVPHRFVTHTYKTPTVCVYCKKLLVGVVRQGKRCKDCKYNVHARCERYVPTHCERQIQDKLRQLSLVNSISRSTSTIESDSDSLIVENPATANLQNSSEPKEVSVTVHVDDKEHHTTSSEEDLKENGSGQEQDETDTSVSDTSSVSEPLSPMAKADDTMSTNNIPLMRIFQSFRNTKRCGNKVLKEGPMKHFTNVDPNRKSHWWRLDTKNLCLYKDKQSTPAVTVIPLSEILAIEYASDMPPAKRNWSPHCFTMRTASLIYYVGENTRQTSSMKMFTTSVGSAASVFSSRKEDANPTQVAESWEEAIRQALMPVTSRVPGSIKKRSGDSKLQHGLSVVRQDAVMEDFQKQVEEEEEEEDIAQRYQIFSDEVLGSGQFGVVYGGVKRLTGHDVAIKVIDKARFPTKQETALKNEVAILENLIHPGIVTLTEMFETSERVFVVMEKMKNDMLEMILSCQKPKGRLPERVTKFITFQVLTALKFLHSKSIVHCDLKPENVLLASDSDMPQVKICDFGFARIIGEKSFRKSVVGTPAYLAPEVLKSRPYNRSLDMWSVGVVVYVSLSGTFPFNEDEEIADQIQNAAFMYPANPWAEISREAIDLVGKLLRVDQRRRYTVAKASNHIWFQTRRAWEDLRRLETQVGQRYLTDEKLDHYWLSVTNPVPHDPVSVHPHLANGTSSASPRGANVNGSEAVLFDNEDRHAEEVEQRLSRLGYQVSPI